MDGPLQVPSHYPAPQLHDGSLFHPSPFPSHSANLAQQQDLSLDPFQFDPQLENQPEIQHPHNRHAFDHHSSFAERPRAQQPRFHEIRSNVPPPTPHQDNAFTSNQADGGMFGVLSTPRPPPRHNGVDGGQFGVLSPHPQLLAQHLNHDEQLGRLQHELDLRPMPVTDGGTTAGHFSDMKMIPDPPQLKQWRQRLFDVDETIMLTEDEFQTYFPHVDNIYSHRSTQRYKRKPFVSHYWDCRLKGRPPGTAKSDDPNKKKRKRQARERDLCDVKIKITEYFPGARSLMGTDFPIETPASDNPFALGRSMSTAQAAQPFGVLNPNSGGSPEQPGNDGARYYTIQRVNGNGANGKGDGTAGAHKHSLEDSDRVKKSSIHRHFLKEEKDRKKSQKTYHKKATGAALNTVKKHSKDHDLKLYGSCFCPFVQRVWISLEVKGLSYQYIEVDPYKKPDELMRINPRGLIPALQHGDWGCYESSVLMEYLEDLNAGAPLLPQGDAKNRAHCRLWSDHINRKILPHFYGLLQAQDNGKQIEEANELTAEIKKIVEAANPAGPFFLGPHISFVDIQFAPWIIRLRKVLLPYRGWPEPEQGSRWVSWVNAIENNEGVKSTTSTDDLYIDSYERYAENRPGTSQVANAVNRGDVSIPSSIDPAATQRVSSLYEQPHHPPHNPMPTTTIRKDCPFCAIALANPPAPIPLPPSWPTTTPSTPSYSSSSPAPTAHLILSTPHLLAFLDHAPISRGHVLLVVRAHREKVGDLRVEEGERVGAWLGVLSRAVVGAVREGKDEGVEGEEGKGDGVEGDEGEGEGEGERKGERDVGDWNIVQNNGARAAQVVPHVHFHIIPRTDDVPEVKARSWTVFGKGQREDLDEADAEVLVRRMRVRVEGEVERVWRREGERGWGRLVGGEVGRGKL